MKYKCMLIGLLLSLIILPSTLAYPEYSSSENITNPTNAVDSDFSTYAIYSYYFSELSTYANLTWYDYVGSNASYSFNISTTSLFDANQYNFMLLLGYNGTDWVNITQADCNGSTLQNHTIDIPNAQTYTNTSGHIQLRFQWYCYTTAGVNCASTDGRIYEVFTVPSTQPTTPSSTSSALATMIITVISIIIAISLLLALISPSDTTKGVDLSSLITTAVISFIGIIIITLLLSFA